MTDAILVLNAGSSSLKFSIFRVSGKVELLLNGQAEGLLSEPKFTASDAQGTVIEKRTLGEGQRFGHSEAVRFLLDWLDEHQKGDHRLVAAGHRVVHGGREFTQPARVDDRVLAALRGLIPLAPLHEPHNIAAIEAIAAHAPHLPQVACFDTAFHRSQPVVAQSYALPRSLTSAGIYRYGFHGLSYEYIASVLPNFDHRAAAGRTVVAHLGNGASMCALKAGRGIATTMGFTAVDGLPMGTRTGTLDPGVLLYLMREYRMDANAIETLIYEKSGLLGVSEIASDMRTLLASKDPRAAEAIDLFVYRIGRELGSLTAALSGLDALVFTGGIGEHAAPIRASVCQSATWLGIQLDESANQSGASRISTADSPTSAWVIPTNEELMICRHTMKLLGIAP